MKKNILVVSIFAALAGMNVAQAQISLHDFVEPDSSYEDAYLSGRLNINSGNQDQTSHDLNLDAYYERVISTPDRDISMAAELQGSSKRGSNSGDETVENYIGNAGVGMNKYFRPNSRGAFWFAAGEVGVKKGADDPRVAAGVGLGYGRVSNLTPMAQAIRVVEALSSRDMISGTLSKGTYNDIANVIAKESEYKSRHGVADYEEFWVADIEKALKASGHVSGALGAAGVLKIYDVLVNERISTRKSGWLVKGGLSSILRDYNGEESKPAFDLGFEYHMPLSNQTQFSNEASYSTILDDDKSYTAQNTMGLTHEVSDRVDWINTWSVNFDHDAVIDRDTTTNAISSTYRYYLNNKLSVDTVASLTKVDDDIADNGNDDVDKSLFMGVTYRLK